MQGCQIARTILGVEEFGVAVIDHPKKTTSKKASPLRSIIVLRNQAIGNKSIRTDQNCINHNIMKSTAESSFEEYNLGEVVHPYMCLYDPILDPSICIYDSDEDYSESSQEEDSGDLIRTSPLQKYAVRYATRIYKVLSEDIGINKDKSEIQKSPPKLTFTNNLPRINVPSHSSVVAKEGFDKRVSPIKKKKKKEQVTGTELTKSISSPSTKDLSPKQGTANKKPNESKVKERNKTIETQTKPNNTGATETDTSKDHGARRYPKRERTASEHSASGTQSESNTSSSIAEGAKQMSANDDPNLLDDYMRRYPKRKRVACEFFVGEPSPSCKSKTQRPKAEDSNDDDDDDSSMEHDGAETSDSEDLKPKKKPRRRKYKQRPNIEVYPNGKYRGTNYDKIAKEKPNEDYSKDIVTDNGERHDKTWNDKFRRVHAYYRENGHFSFARGGTDFDANQLGMFCTAQRIALREKVLHPDRFRRLNSINFDWDPTKNHVWWDDHFANLVKFKKKFGHANVPKRYKANPKLGSWCRNQRMRYLFKTTMSQEKIDRLESIGFRWHGFPERAMRERCVELKEFYEEHKHYRVPLDYPNQLGRWAQLRREEYARKTLPKDEKNMLKKIGFDFRLGKTRINSPVPSKNRTEL